MTACSYWVCASFREELPYWMELFTAKTLVCWNLDLERA
ncbi:hypothetical protein EMIT0P291_100027 [Pseudomonas sp. IT-P291]